MRTITAIEHFGTRANLARALGITRAAISEWGDIIPRGKAFELQVLTDGVLKVDLSVYDKPQKVA